MFIIGLLKTLLQAGFIKTKYEEQLYFFFSSPPFFESVFLFVLSFFFVSAIFGLMGWKENSLLVLCHLRQVRFKKLRLHILLK